MAGHTTRHALLVKDKDCANNGKRTLTLTATITVTAAPTVTVTVTVTATDDCNCSYESLKIVFFLKAPLAIY